MGHCTDGVGFAASVYVLAQMSCQLGCHRKRDLPRCNRI
jgi:hypothetical protein